MTSMVVIIEVVVVVVVVMSKDQWFMVLARRVSLPTIPADGGAVKSEFGSIV
jgi:hypothetical protein